MLQIFQVQENLTTSLNYRFQFTTHIFIMPAMTKRAHVLQGMEAIILHLATQIDTANNKLADAKDWVMMIINNSNKGSATVELEMKKHCSQEEEISRLKQLLSMTWDAYNDVQDHFYLSTRCREGVKHHQIPNFQRFFNEPAREFKHRVSSRMINATDLTNQRYLERHSISS